MAVAAAQLLPHLPSAADLLRRADAVPALMSAFLAEHAQSDLDLMAGADLPGVVVGAREAHMSTSQELSAKDTQR